MDHPYLLYPEKFERVGIHVLVRVLREEVLAKRLYTSSTSFATYLYLEEAFKATVKWRDVDDAILDFQEEPAHYGIERAGDTTMKTLQRPY